ncbi:MAG: tetratricopeptide repeat protein [Bacteroidales bacterium]|nr:tetratricopeptide repeat protein [Bacteroidales bacterium]
MRWIKIIFIYSLVMIAMSAFAQKERKYIRQGNKEFENANFENSEVSYRKAVDLEEKKTHEPAFNVGDALYKQEKYEDAIEQFNSLTDVEVSKQEKAKIYHNIGNSLLQSNKLQESVEAYKNALRNNPNDMETKYNLAYAQKKLEEQEQQQDQNQDQNKDNQDQNKDQQDQDKNKDNQDQNQDQKKDKQNQNKDQQQQPQISKEDAERILQALANDEKDTQEKVKEQQAAAAKVKAEKEW